MVETRRRTEREAAPVATFPTGTAPADGPLSGPKESAEGPAPQPPPGPRLRSLIARGLGLREDRLDAEASLASQGLDSLRAVELAAEIGAALGRDLAPGVLFDHPSVAALERWLASGAAGGVEVRARRLELIRADARLPDDVRPAAAPPAAEPRAILLTGATGYLGAHLLARLLADTRAEVHCLVRPRPGVEPGARIARALERASGAAAGCLPARVRVVDGDVAEPALGLGPERFAALGRSVGAIYHVAAIVDWVRPYEDLRRANVVGLLELLRLACLGGAAATPLHLVSTLAACRSTTGPAEVDEATDALAAIDGLHMGYAQTKAVAEALARAAAARGLPVSIYRPGLIAGDARSGLANREDFLARLFRGCVEMGAAPDLDWWLDALPVDFVSLAIARLARAAPAAGLTVHHVLHPRRRRWRECVLFMRLFGYPMRLVPYPAWREELAAATDPEHALRPLRSFFLAPADGGEGLSLAEVYQEGRSASVRADETRRRLDALGLAPPPLDARLLDRWFRSYMARGVLPKPAPRTGASAAAADAPLDAAFFADVLGAGRGGERLRVREAATVARGSEHGIISELCSWRSGFATGLSFHRLSVERAGGRVEPLEVVVKTSPGDEVVLDVAEEVARLADERLGQAFARHRARLELSGARRRELAVYRQADPRFRRHAPAVHGARDPAPGGGGGGCLVLERLRDVELLDSADDVRGWGERQVDAAVRGLAELHAIHLGREADLGWLAPVPTSRSRAEMGDLWSALAAHAAGFPEWFAAGLPALHARLAAGVGAWWAELEAHPRTLIHNDFNPRNIALRTGPDARLCAYDWELATLGAPQHDLAELLCFVRDERIEPAELDLWLERHRRGLELASGRALERAAWRRGFHLALCDLLVNRLSMYALVHAFRRQAFLGRVVATWRALFDLTRPRAPGA